MYALLKGMTARCPLLGWTLVKRFGIFRFTPLKDVPWSSSAADAGLDLADRVGFAVSTVDVGQNHELECTHGSVNSTTITVSLETYVVDPCMFVSGTSQL